MAAYLLRIERVQSGSNLETGSIVTAVSTEAQVNQQLARSPDNIACLMNIATEVQVRGLLHYAQAIDGEVDTSSVETAISAII